LSSFHTKSSWSKHQGADLMAGDVLASNKNPIPQSSLEHEQDQNSLAKNSKEYFNDLGVITDELIESEVQSPTGSSEIYQDVNPVPVTSFIEQELVAAELSSVRGESKKISNRNCFGW